MKNSISIGFIAFWVLASSAVFGTVQKPDKIIYRGKEYNSENYSMVYNLENYPMEEYFEKYPDKRPKSDVTSTALWRGYVATFEIQDGQLYLKDIEIEISTKVKNDRYEYSWKSVLNEVFPNQDLVKMDWVTGLLVLYTSDYEQYILLEVDKGDLKSNKWFEEEEYKEFKEKQFQAFKKTEEYEKIKAKLRKEYDNLYVEDCEKYGEESALYVDDESIESNIKYDIMEYTSKILVEEEKENPTWGTIVCIIALLFVCGYVYKKVRNAKKANNAIKQTTS